MNATPKRLQRHRTRGWNAAAAAGNGLPVAFVHRPFKFGNPFKAEEPTPEARGRAVAAYEKALVGGKLPYGVEEIRAELKGKNLACFCPIDGPCHADLLLRIANG